MRVIAVKDGEGGRTVRACLQKDCLKPVRCGLFCSTTCATEWQVGLRREHKTAVEFTAIPAPVWLQV